MVNTEQQFDSVVAICRSVFSKKAKDYGSAWRILRPVSITDQLFIKANRIRSLELKGVSKVDEGIENEFVALLNYSVMGIIQLERGFASEADFVITSYSIHYTKLYDVVFLYCGCIGSNNHRSIGVSW